LPIDPQVPLPFERRSARKNDLIPWTTRLTSPAVLRLVAVFAISESLDIGRGRFGAGSSILRSLYRRKNHQVWFTV
jgi:hypothetical protein